MSKSGWSIRLSSRIVAALHELKLLKEPINHTRFSDAPFGRWCRSNCVPAEREKVLNAERIADHWRNCWTDERARIFLRDKGKKFFKHLISQLIIAWASATLQTILWMNSGASPEFFGDADSRNLLTYFDWVCQAYLTLCWFVIDYWKARSDFKPFRMESNEIKMR